MRQPLEDGTVCIARAAMSRTFPARFRLAAAMNPCPCGFHNDRIRECHCTAPMIQRYISKISGPLLDRIDIHIDVPAMNYKEMRSTSEPESSAKILERVIRARDLQLARFSSKRQNSAATRKCLRRPFANSASFPPIVSACLNAPWRNLAPAPTTAF
jgi:magnesium chelatase family protein